MMKRATVAPKEKAEVERKWTGEKISVGLESWGVFRGLDGKFKRIKARAEKIYKGRSEMT